jgi:DHA2 family multidrug resistance protein
MDSSPPQTLSKEQWIGFIAMVVGMFLAILDVQVVASSLTQIQAALSCSSDEISWVQTSYVIAEIIVIPLSGWFAKAFSTRYLYVGGCALFTLFSIACSFSWSLESMIIFRVFQGFFGGVLIPCAFSLIFILFPKEKQTNITIFVGLVITLAPTIGPVIGGYLTEVFSWPMIFLVNVIPGLIICVITWLYVDVDKPKFDMLLEIDYLGIFCIAVFLGSLQYVLEEGARENWFDSNKIITMSVIAGFFCFFTLYRELTCKKPILDLYAFSNRNFTLGCIFSFIMGWGLFAALFLMPTYLSLVKDLNSFDIGFYMMAAGLFQFASAAFAKLASIKLGLRSILFIGIFGYGLGLYLNGFVSYEDGYREFFYPQAMRGFFVMFFFLPINELSFGTLSKEEINNASSLYNLMRNLGGAVGIAVLNTGLIQNQKHYFSLLRESTTHTATVSNQWLEGVSAYMGQFDVSLPLEKAIQVMTLVFKREALILAYNHAYLITAAMFFISCLFVVFFKKTSSEVGVIKK